MYKPYLQPAGGGARTFSPYPQSPLHAFDLPAQAVRQDESRGIWMNEVALLGYILLRGDSADPAFNGAVRQALDVALPAQPGDFAVSQHGVLLWQSPDEWLLVCGREQLGTHMSSLESALSGMHAQVVDNSGGLTQVYLTGREHQTVLRHVGVYDFAALTPGRVAGTVCGKAGMVVYRVDERGVFVILRRSFADYIWRLLGRAARPYRCGINTLERDPAHPVLRLL
jgi:sarcosine oxidase, subunit gamma